MHTICNFHTFDADLLYVLVLVLYHQGNKLRQFLENPNIILTLLIIGSILKLICHEHQYIIKGTILRILKRPGYVQ